ncbi:hypothetical protein [Bradyrhizobium sp.]|jgi:hypothetical protein|uniref:hypothetical protein n=1 Tax=Bradyrhizobium sp. TaxID=376 RepID=UPI003C13D9F5
MILLKKPPKKSPTRDRLTKTETPNFIKPFKLLQVRSHFILLAAQRDVLTSAEDTDHSLGLDGREIAELSAAIQQISYLGAYR